MNNLKKELLDVIEEAYDKRLRPRLQGLTDEEYLWEPVPDCWTIHRSDDGSYRADWGLVFDEIPPFTTIAWRMRHLIDCYGSRRAATWLGLEQRPAPLEKGTPGSAADALRMLDEAHRILVDTINAAPDEDLWSKIGPVGGIYADHTKFSLLMHQLDEVVHHGAEIALLRDLYRAQHRNENPFVLACLKGDRSAVDDMRKQDASIVETTIAANPGLMLRAAETGRWDAVPLLAELGFPVDGTNGRGPLHHAAGAGNIEAMRLLVDRGADLGAKDPVYQATPLGWAEYFGEDAAAEYLRALKI
jgi:hypothetical protein